MDIFFTTIISTLGGVGLASYTYYLTKLREKEAEWRKEKLRIYIEFVESISGITDGEGCLENDIRFAKACNNLYLFSNSKVLETLKIFQNQVSRKNTEKSFERYTNALTNLILEIRKDIDIKDAYNNTLKVLLWTSGTRLNKSSTTP